MVFLGPIVNLHGIPHKRYKRDPFFYCPTKFPLQFPFPFERLTHSHEGYVLSWARDLTPVMTLLNSLSSKVNIQPLSVMTSFCPVGAKGAAVVGRLIGITVGTRSAKEGTSLFQKAIFSGSMFLWTEDEGFSDTYCLSPRVYSGQETFSAVGFLQIEC